MSSPTLQLWQRFVRGCSMLSAKRHTPSFLRPVFSVVRTVFANIGRTMSVESSILKIFTSALNPPHLSAYDSFRPWKLSCIACYISRLPGSFQTNDGPTLWYHHSHILDRRRASTLLSRARTPLEHLLSSPTWQHAVQRQPASTCCLASSPRVAEEVLKV